MSSIESTSVPPFPIILVQDPSGGRTTVVVDRPLEIGRECDGVLVADESVSRRHVLVVPDDRGCTVEDLGSSNGTTCNGEPVEGGVRLGLGDVVRIGSCEIRLSSLVAIERDPSRGPAAASDLRGTVIVRPRGSAVPDASAPARSTGVRRRPLAEDSDLRGTAIGALASVVTADDEAQDRIARLSNGASGTLTFLFSDIESSTETAEQLGDQRWYEVLSVHNELIERVVAAHRGLVVKALGDGHLCTFGSARDAILGAGAIQRDLDVVDLGGIRVRMGLHTGEAITANGDIFGLHVNVAARIAGRAGGAQILVSGLTRAIAQTSGDLSFGPEHEVELKGLAGRYSVSELIWS